MELFYLNLRKLVEENGKSQRELTKNANVDRSTLSKILAGTLRPSAAYLEKLLHAIKASDEKKSEIWKAFNRMHSQEDSLPLRTSVKHLLENLCYFRQANTFHVQPSSLQVSLPLAEHMGTLAVEGALRGLLYDLATSPTGKGSPEIYLCPNFPATLLRLIAVEGRALSGDRITVYHTLRLATAAQGFEGAAKNIDLLSLVIPASVCEQIQYLARFYYENTDFSQDPAMILPCCAVFGEAVLLLEKGGTEAFVIRDRSIADYYRRKLHELHSRAQILVESQTELFNLVNWFQETDQYDPIEYQIHGQPCLSRFLTWEIVKESVTEEVAASSQTMNAIQTRLQHLASLDEQTSIFTEAGIIKFYESGRLKDIPEVLYHPLSLAARHQMITTLKNHCLRHPKKYWLLHTQELQISDSVSLDILKSGNAYILLCEDKTLNAIHIREETIANAFQQFARYLIQNLKPRNSQEISSFFDRCLLDLEQLMAKSDI